MVNIGFPLPSFNPDQGFQFRKVKVIKLFPVSHSPFILFWEEFSGKKIVSYKFHWHHHPHYCTSDLANNSHRLGFMWNFDCNWCPSDWSSRPNRWCLEETNHKFPMGQDTLSISVGMANSLCLSCFGHDSRSCCISHWIRRWLLCMWPIMWGISTTDTCCQQGNLHGGCWMCILGYHGIRGRINILQWEHRGNWYNSHSIQTRGSNGSNPDDRLEHICQDISSICNDSHSDSRRSPDDNVWHLFCCWFIYPSVRWPQLFTESLHPGILTLFGPFHPKMDFRTSGIYPDRISIHGSSIVCPLIHIDVCGWCCWFLFG